VLIGYFVVFVEKVRDVLIDGGAGVEGQLCVLNASRARASEKWLNPIHQ
jgi:hypothetical protein